MRWKTVRDKVGNFRKEHPDLAVLMAISGLVSCASHADLIEVKTQVNNLTGFQEQVQKQEESLQRRMQALEGRVTAARPAPAPEDPEQRADRQRLKDLSVRVKSLEDRLLRFEETLRSQTVQEYKAPPLESPSAVPGAGSVQSKPAKLAPLDSGLKMPGTPELTPTSAFNLALNDYQNGRYELALMGFQKFVKDFPSANLTPDAFYWTGETYYSMHDYVRAIPAFEQVVTEFPRSDKVPAALFKLGLATAETGDMRRARNYLKRVIEEYKDSTEAKLAKNRLADLR